MKGYATNKSILKAISILESFNRLEIELSCAEISKKTGLHRATTHRILATLTGSGMLHQINETGRYTIGLSLFKLGMLYLDTIDVFKIVKPVMEMLNELTKEDVLIGMLEQGNVVFVMGEESKFDLRIGRRVGEYFPAYASAMGKALLSAMTDTELDSLYPEEKLHPVTRKTIATKTKLKQVLAEVKRTGISYDREGGRIGVEGFATVIRDASGQAISALVIAIPVIRSNRANRKRVMKLVKMAADFVSLRLGYQDGPNTICEIQEIRSWWDRQEPLSHI